MGALDGISILTNLVRSTLEDGARFFYLLENGVTTAPGAPVVVVQQGDSGG